MVRSIRKRAVPWRSIPPELDRLLSESEQASARDALKDGMALVCRASQVYAGENLLDENRLSILSECVNRIEEYGLERPEYFILALHIMAAGWKVRGSDQKEVLK